LVLEDPIPSTADAVVVPGNESNSSPLKVSPQPIASGAQIESASVAQDSFGNTLITIELTAAGGAQMHATTAKNVGRKMAIMAGGRAISVATIRDPVDAHIQISGKWSLAEARAIAESLGHR